MFLPVTLLAYLGRHFLLSLAAVLGALLALLLIADSIELLRRAAKREAVELAQIAAMALLKLPSSAHKLLPFACLFGALASFSRLTRSSELVATRAAGVSVWQFLLPATLLAFLLGLLAVAVLNPLSAVLALRFEILEAKFLEGRVSLLTVSPTGLWLRQGDRQGQQVVHALRVSAEGMRLSEVTIYLYQGGDRFVGRLDARQAQLLPGAWLLQDGLKTAANGAVERFQDYRLPTSLTVAQAQESFASPSTLSFWTLPRFIDGLRQAGFSALLHRLHWHSLLATPLLLAVMVPLAAAFSLRFHRRGGAGLVIGAGVLSGFLLYFLGDLVRALGQSGSVPIVLAAWAPGAISLLAALALLFHLEDG
ncbi:MAG: LPS export ABC transporter permease LptG [Alphaproteobacteria bacterium]|nr:LPS export ABC transporter permease LptG [Alphaproteobacteria bacterium]